MYKRFHSFQFVVFVLAMTLPSLVHGGESLRLAGTIIHSEFPKSVASINGKAFHPFDLVEKRYELIDIRRFTVTVKDKVSGKTERVRVSSYDSKKSVGKKNIMTHHKSKFHIRRDLVDSITSNLPQFLNDAGTESVHDANGGIVGFRLTYIKPNGIFSNLGLKKGDVLEEVNGIKLNSLEAGLYIYQQFRNSSMIELDIKRGGKKRAIKYLIR